MNTVVHNYVTQVMQSKLLCNHYEQQWLCCYGSQGLVGVSGRRDGGLATVGARLPPGEWMTVTIEINNLRSYANQSRDVHGW